MLITDSWRDDYAPEPLGERPGLEEACENLRMIRQMMERPTRHSSLSGFSGILVGIWAILGVWATATMPQMPFGKAYLVHFGLIWLAVLLASAVTDYLITKRRAAQVGKRVFSKLGAHIVTAAAPGFVAGFFLSAYFSLADRLHDVYGCWMLAYGLAICAVSLFSVPPVRYLGWAFVLAGALTLFLPASASLIMMSIAFGGFHIAYGLYTGLTRRDW